MELTHNNKLKFLDFIISSGNKNIGFLLPDNSYGYLLYDTIEKVLNRNNLFPSRVEFLKMILRARRVGSKENHQEGLKSMRNL